ncbi:hypothetical protein VCHE40_0266B, partial [Vibrio cholerae HE-40]
LPLEGGGARSVA